MKVVFRLATGQELETEAYSQLNMLAHAQLIELSLQSRCGGQCVCSTCRIVVTEGQLSPMTPSEEQLLTKVRALDGKTRLACQCFPVSETITVEVPAKPFADARQEVLK